MKIQVHKGTALDRKCLSGGSNSAVPVYDWLWIYKYDCLTDYYEGTNIGI